MGNTNMKTGFYFGSGDAGWVRGGHGGKAGAADESGACACGTKCWR